MKLNILLIGCNGEIGTALYKNLKERYDWILCDTKNNPQNETNFYKSDFTNPEEVRKIFTEHKIDVVISLIGLPEAPNIPEPDLFEKMVKIYLCSTYYMLEAMRETRVKKIIFASSNHVTDFYEKDGFSVLGREITSEDYPKSRSVYGSLKLASESLCHNYWANYGIESVSFRIGTFRRKADIKNRPERWDRTILYEEDLVKYFVAAIEKPAKADVYYLVSDNKNKPWANNDLKDLTNKKESLA